MLRDSALRLNDMSDVSVTLRRKAHATVAEFCRLGLFAFNPFRAWMQPCSAVLPAWFDCGYTHVRRTRNRSRKLIELNNKLALK